MISDADDAPIYGRGGRIGAIVPANNSVIEPEWWSTMPEGVALHATRVLALGNDVRLAALGILFHV